MFRFRFCHPALREAAVVPPLTGVPALALWLTAGAALAQAPDSQPASEPIEEIFVTDSRLATAGLNSHADAMFVALKKLGVDTRIALYPNEGHGISHQPRHTADYHQRAMAWFDNYLKQDAEGTRER